MTKKMIEDSVKKRIKGEARKKLQMEKAEIGKGGEEILDEKPLFAEVGFTEPPSLNDRIRQITAQVQADTLARLQAEQLTEEQAKALLDAENDFEIDGDVMDMLTSYELAGVVSELEEDIAVIDTAPEPLPVSPSIMPGETETTTVSEETTPSENVVE
jgi:hypothetical protein